MASTEKRARQVIEKLKRGDVYNAGHPANPDGSEAVEIIEELLFILKAKKRIVKCETSS